MRLPAPRSLALRVSLAALVLVVSSVTLLAACGGSSSDTPWPVPPESTPGPAGESARSPGGATATEASDAGASTPRRE